MTQTEQNMTFTAKPESQPEPPENEATQTAQTESQTEESEVEATEAAQTEPQAEPQTEPETETAASPEPAPKARKKIKLGYLITTGILAVAVTLCVIFAVQLRSQGYASIGGISLFRVVTESMEPTITEGELLICRAVDFDAVAEGDIICFRSSLPNLNGAIVTHRVTNVSFDREGQPCFITQGDANLVADALPVYEEDLVGKVVWHSSQESVLNDILRFLTGNVGFLTCIVFPILLAAGLVLQSTVRNLNREIMRYKQAMRAPSEMPDGSAEDALPGYDLLTQEDYDEILNHVLAELLEEQKNYAAASIQEKTE